MQHPFLFEQGMLLPPPEEESLYPHSLLFSVPWSTLRVFSKIYQDRKWFFDPDTNWAHLHVLLSRYNPNLGREVALVFAAGLLITLIRPLLWRLLVRKKLYAHNLLEPKNERRLESCFYKFWLHLLVSVIAGLATVWFGYFNPVTLMAEVNLLESKHWLVHLITLLEAGHLVHEILHDSPRIASADFSRFDSLLMLSHHVVGLVMLGIGHAGGYLHLIVPMMLYFDPSDVCIAAFKAVDRVRLDRLGYSAQTQKRLKFACLVASNVVCAVSKLLLYPALLVYPCLQMLVHNPTDRWLPLCLPLCLIMITLQGMNFYWCSVLLRVLLRAMNGQGMGDIRDREVQQHESQNSFDQNSKNQKQKRT